MGKAYSEEKKIEIKKRLWEEGIKLFHEEGAQELNIRELTKRAGISLSATMPSFSTTILLAFAIVLIR